MSRRAPRRPCTPETLGDPCVGHCGRKMHSRPPKGAQRGLCTDGHPVEDTDGRCASCAQRWREDNPHLVSKVGGYRRRRTLISLCPHDEGERCACPPEMFAVSA